MCDLEDAFLKKNVPGRYSSWVEDDADDNSNNRGQDESDSGSDDNDIEDDEFYFKDLPQLATSQQQNATSMPLLRPSGNTGVKGVIADYKEAKREEQLKKAEELMEKFQRSQRATSPSIRSRKGIASKINQQQSNDSEKGSDDNDGSDSVDDDFIKRFRMQRLAQLQNKSITMPTFGTLSYKHPVEFIDLVDEIDPRVFVVVHLFEPTISESRMLHSALDKVAQAMEYARFIEVNALEANPTLDLVCLPAILIYKGGTLVNNVIKFTDCLPKSFTVDDVKDALEATGIV
jgi:hypothetical protein